MVKGKAISGLAAQDRPVQLLKFGSPVTDCWPQLKNQNKRMKWPLCRVPTKAAVE